MRVLMFGWEFPPQFSGGLGVACEGLVRGLLQTGAEVVLVLPRYPHRKSSGRLRILEALQEAPAASPSPSLPRRPSTPPETFRRAAALRIRRVGTAIRPYPEAVEAEPPREDAGLPREDASTAPAAATASLYGPNLATEVLRYAARAAAIARGERFDVIHAHDWMTFPAGLEARRVSGKPLVVHVHATEYDRAGEGGNPFVREIEREGVARADRVIAVSRYTAERLGREYGVPRRHLRVVHNAIDAGRRENRELADGDAPLVLFAGRVTWQKGPEYFVEAAARVSRELPEARFAVAGSGDRLPALRERVRQLGLERRVLFTGFLPPHELDRLYRRADVYVMPSFSEPFGLTALEALRHGTPVIVSRGAGVSEVVRNVLTVDFGDVEDLASKILSVLLFAPLSTTLSRRGGREVDRLSWRRSAERVRSVYAELARRPGAAPPP